MTIDVSLRYNKVNKKHNMCRYTNIVQLHAYIHSALHHTLYRQLFFEQVAKDAQWCVFVQAKGS